MKIWKPFLNRINSTLSNSTDPHGSNPRKARQSRRGGICQGAKNEEIFAQQKFPSVPLTNTAPEGTLAVGVTTKEQPMLDPYISDLIASRLALARKKHPQFGGTKYIISEIGEFIYASDHETRARMKDEALDVIVTCVRLLLDEDLSDGKAQTR